MRDISIWIELKRQVPDKLKHLCRLCHEYNDFINSMQNVYPSITGWDVERMMGLLHQILTEYLQVLRSEGISERDLNKIEQDITVGLSSFLNRQGKLMPLTPDFERYMARGVLGDLHLPLFLSPFTSIIDSKILNSFLVSRDKTKRYWEREFARHSAMTGGVSAPLELEVPDIIGGRKRAKEEED